VVLWRGLSEGYRWGKILFAAQIVKLHDLAMNSLQAYGSIGCSSKLRNGLPLISGIWQKFGNPPEQRATVSPYSNKPGAVQRVAVPSGPDLDYAGSCARKPPSLAVALNCGTGSSFLNALVKAFDKLHIILAENSGYYGSK
jgi:hypothetical protein